ncbi:MAG TPA: shikimate kinase [Blastocatellia bacterium]
MTHIDSERPIFLVGFMGAGKTTVGRVLAKRLKRRFIDLDDMIEQIAGAAVQEIFRIRGEEAFRAIERDAIELLTSAINVIVALGGGAYVAAANRDSLRSIGTTVWIDCPLEMCLSRISSDTSRPLLGSAGEMEKLLSRRRAAYAEADIRIQTGNRGPGTVARAIIQALQEAMPPDQETRRPSSP